MAAPDAGLRVLVTDNLGPDPASPWRGQFVRDQVAALRALGVDVEHASFAPGRWTYPRTTVALRRRLRAARFDLVHAHYGITGWCALLAGAKRLVVTLHGTDVRHPLTGALSRRLAPRLELLGLASRRLLAPEGGRPGVAALAGGTAVLPCGADLERFRSRPRAAARRELGLREEGRYLLFPASPGRRVKRHDRARELAELVGAELLTAGPHPPQRMPLLVNAADAVLVTSDNEGFGLAAVEALACDVPVLSTPVGIAPALLADLPGCLCAPFDAERWADAVAPHLDAADARVGGRKRAERFAATAMAERVLVAYRELLGSREPVAGPDGQGSARR